MLIPSYSGKPPSPCFIISFREKGRSLADTGVLVAVPHCPVLLWRIFSPAAARELLSAGVCLVRAACLCYSPLWQPLMTA